MSQCLSIFRTIELDGQTIRTAVRPGDGSMTPLLIFNGIGANLELVMPFVHALDPDLEVIAFDVPGVGGSDPRPARPTASPAWPSWPHACSTTSTTARST